MKILKSVGAVLAGFFGNAVLSIGTDVLVYILWGVKPFSRPMTDILFALAVVYRSVFGVVGGFVTARLAPKAPMRHAMILGVLALVLSVAGIAEAWNHPEMGPHWYAVAITMIAFPSTWFGGRLGTGAGVLVRKSA